MYSKAIEICCDITDASIPTEGHVRPEHTSRFLIYNNKFHMTYLD